MKYSEFLAAFPAVSLLNTMARITLYRLFRNGRVVAIHDLQTGILRFLPPRLPVGELV